MIVGCYDMHLYCDGAPEDDHTYEERRSFFPAEFAGATEGSCRKQARRAGWMFVGRDRVLCPVCAKKKADYT